jgi:hypothetical protein
MLNNIKKRYCKADTAPGVDEGEAADDGGVGFGSRKLDRLLFERGGAR